MKRVFYVATICLLATAAKAEGHYSDIITGLGPSGAAQTLYEQPDLAPSDAFALGGMRFLGAIERSLQTRYDYGMTGDLTSLISLPFLRLPVDDNPTPKAFTPDVVNGIFADAMADFAEVLAPLDTITDDDAVSVPVDTASLWFDINRSGARDPGEGLFEVAGGMPGGGIGDDFIPPVVQFDTADAAWLSAYGHLLTGLSATILALDPAAALETTLISGAQLDTLRDAPFEGQSFWVPDRNPVSLDVIAALLIALESQPDPALTRIALAHFRDAMTDNKVFWARVAAETDNDSEWIPSDNQDSALPISFPEGTGARWQAVLADAEGLLNGDLLYPHWRLGDQVGIDIAAMMENPPDLDLAGILQGRTVLPYARQGQLVSPENLWAFRRMFRGDSQLFMIILN